VNNVIAISTGADPGENLRRQSRTAMFVATTLAIAGQSNPVRVRNMSATGALIEGPVLPATGADALLLRGPLRVRGRVTWKAGDQCGLAFLDSVEIGQWMARAASDATGSADVQPVLGRASEAAHLRAAIAIVEGVERVLASEREILIRHSDQVKALARAGELLRALAPNLRAAH
jgi:hypothetical protein